MNGTAHTPCSVRTVLLLPSIRFAELLSPEMRHHRCDIEITTDAPGLHHRRHGQGGCVVWIIRCGFVHLAERAVRIRVLLDECERAIDCCRLRSECSLGHIQERLEYKGSQRLAGAQQAIRRAVKSA